MTNMPSDRSSSVDSALVRTRGAWLHVGVFSSIVNTLMLTGSLYMIQVYDRVLASRSVPTLVGLSLLALAAFTLQGVLDALRLRVLGRIGAIVDAELAPAVARAGVVLPLRGLGPAEALQPIRDLDAVRAFLSGLGPTALLDMPFMPVFLFGCYLLHPWLGAMALAGALIVLGLTYWTERLSRPPMAVLGKAAGERTVLMDAGRANAEVIAAMGMGQAYHARVLEAHDRVVGGTLMLGQATGGVAAMAKTVRFILQSASLGLGAYLVILGELSPGAMIGTSILMSRALAPIELAVANWKGFVAAREGLARLRRVLPLLAEPSQAVDLPLPSRTVDVRDVIVVAPGTQKPILQGVSLALKAGQAVGLIGPSGSGKSTLARALVGVWPAARGEIRMDGALIGQWSRARLGTAIGYLPQDVELFDGTIADNISRFTATGDSEAVLHAARLAGAHEMIVSYPEGYTTRIGEGGMALSGGQRQRIALARALYGDPFLVVLDEPNSSLDAEGNEALTRAVRTVKARGGVVVVITHRAAGLAAVDLVGAMTGGRMQAFGLRDEVLKAVMPQGARRPPGPVTALAGRAKAGGEA